MDLRKALGIFRLDGRIPMEDLNSRFRDLVKKYHPDKVRDFPDWAHERMAEINDAYETLAAWIASPPPQKNEQNVDEVIRRREPEPADSFESGREPAGSDGDYRPFRETPRMPDSLSADFYQQFNGFLDGLGLYYQYGLDRPAYREEGVRRFRFREALRSTEKHRDGLEALAKRSGHPVVTAVYRFSRLTVADIHLGEHVFEPGPPVWKRFDQRLKTARRHFDTAVREILFPELMPDHRKGNTVSLLYASYTEFILYVTVFSEGERRNAGILQAARYDAFTELLDLRNEGLLEF